MSERKLKEQAEGQAIGEENAPNTPNFFGQKGLREHTKDKPSSKRGEQDKGTKTASKEEIQRKVAKSNNLEIHQGRKPCPYHA